MIKKYRYYSFIGVFLLTAVAQADEELMGETVPETQEALKKNGVYSLLGSQTILNTGVGAMVYYYERSGSKCHILLDRTDFENVMKNGLKIEKEQVMGFSCHPYKY